MIVVVHRLPPASWQANHLNSCGVVIAACGEGEGVKEWMTHKSSVNTLRKL